MSGRTDTLIIGIGNEYRGDDEVGLYVARELLKETAGDFVIKESPGEGVQLMNAWEGFRKVIIIDAVKSTSSPGTIHRINAAEQELPDPWVHHSAHAVGLSEAIRLARTLKTLPGIFLIFGIEGRSFDPGTGLSDEVRRAADTLVATLLDELNAIS